MAARSGQPAAGGRRPRWPFFLLALLAAVSLLLHAEESRRRREIRAAGSRLEALVRARPVDEARERRASYYKARFFLAYPTAASFLAADFVRRAAALFRPGELLDLRIDAGLHGFDFQLSVAMARRPRAAMPWRLAVLLEKLRGFPEVSGVSSSEKAPIGPPLSGRAKVFLITGRAELP
jgi:hypothetical protein